MYEHFALILLKTSETKRFRWSCHIFLSLSPLPLHCTVYIRLFVICSIFSLGKIIASPRYGQYPDLSDEEEEDQVFADHHLSLPYDPLSLPTIRQVRPLRHLR